MLNQLSELGKSIIEDAAKLFTCFYLISLKV